MEGWRGRRGGSPILLSLSLLLWRVSGWVGIPESSLLALVAEAEAAVGDELDMTPDLHNTGYRERKRERKGGRMRERTRERERGFQR